MSNAVSRSSVPSDLAQIFEPIRDDLQTVENDYVRHIQSRVELIPHIGRYIQNSGGKRVRPALLLMASRLSGYQGPQAIFTHRSSSSFTPPRSYTTISSTMRTFGADASRYTRGGATKLLCCSATTSISSPWDLP